MDREFGAEEACKFVKRSGLAGPAAQPRSLPRCITQEVSEFGGRHVRCFERACLLEQPMPAQSSGHGTQVTPMETPETRPARIEALRAEWTDQYVRANPARPELKRFGDIVGRVVTVNFNGKAIVDFQDGGWYDITGLGGIPRPRRADRSEGQIRSKTNSAQPFPEKQG